MLKLKRLTKHEYNSVSYAIYNKQKLSSKTTIKTSIAIKANWTVCVCKPLTQTGDLFQNSSLISRILLYYCLNIVNMHFSFVAWKSRLYTEIHFRIFNKISKKKNTAYVLCFDKFSFLLIKFYLTAFSHVFR